MTAVFHKDVDTVCVFEGLGLCVCCSGCFCSLKAFTLHKVSFANTASPVSLRPGSVTPASRTIEGNTAPCSVLQSWSYAEHLQNRMTTIVQNGGVEHWLYCVGRWSHDGRVVIPVLLLYNLLKSATWHCKVKSPWTSMAGHGKNKNAYRYADVCTDPWAHWWQDFRRHPTAGGDPLIHPKNMDGQYGKHDNWSWAWQAFLFF